MTSAKFVKIVLKVMWPCTVFLRSASWSSVTEDICARTAIVVSGCAPAVDRYKWIIGPGYLSIPCARCDNQLSRNYELCVPASVVRIETSDPPWEHQIYVLPSPFLEGYLQYLSYLQARDAQCHELDRVRISPTCYPQVRSGEGSLSI